MKVTFEKNVTCCRECPHCEDSEVFVERYHVYSAKFCGRAELRLKDVNRVHEDCPFRNDEEEKRCEPLSTDEIYKRAGIPNMMKGRRLSVRTMSPAEKLLRELLQKNTTRKR